MRRSPIRALVAFFVGSILQLLAAEHVSFEDSHLFSPLWNMAFTKQYVLFIVIDRTGRYHIKKFTLCCNVGSLLPQEHLLIPKYKLL